MVSCWLKWSASSGGIRHWAIYAYNFDCNYPAFVLYLLTISQSCINSLHAVQTGSLAVLIIKLPNLIACLLGTWICLIGTRPLMGRDSLVQPAELMTGTANYSCKFIACSSL